jgi:histidyl-tRNA synthetase
MGTGAMIRLVRGFKDILPGETGLWQHVEGVARELFDQFGFAEVRPPILEQTELFARSIGADTDIVEKEMYTFTDQGGKSLTMRPEATASVVRTYMEHKLYAKDPVWKLYTLGPMFRRERPQKGRYRQFHQINAEVLGLHDPKADAELVFLLMTLMKRVEVPGIALHINSLGCGKCRPRFKESLRSFLEGRTGQLCSDCLKRRERNPLRVFDCKVATCREAMGDAPSIMDHLCEACRNHLETVQRALDDFGIPFETDHRLVRGLDYYTRTTFEVLGRSLGAQDAVAGGGRYDGLLKALGGPDLPGVGFAVGLDRLIELLTDRARGFEKRPRLFIAALGPSAQERGFKWLQALRMEKIRAEMDFEDRSLKAQMRRANKLDASYALIVGDRELAEGAAILRDLKTKTQERVPLNGLVGVIAGRVQTGHDSL